MQGKDSGIHQDGVHILRFYQIYMVSDLVLCGWFNTGKMVPFGRLHMRQAPHRENGSLHLIFILQSHNSFFPGMSLVLLKLLLLSTRLGWVLAISESVHRPFTGICVFLAIFCLTRIKKHKPHLFIMPDVVGAFLWAQYQWARNLFKMGTLTV